MFNIRKAYVWVLLMCCFSSAQASIVLDGGNKRPSSLFEYLFEKAPPKTVNIDLHLRSAFHGNSKVTEDSNKWSFRTDHIMLGIYGNITDRLSYNYRHRLNYNGKAFSTENLNNSLDYAFLRYDVNNHFAVTAGRQAVLVGGFEYQQYPIDVYDYSGISNNLTSYLTGINFAIKPVENQEIVVQVLNNRTGTMEEAYGNSLDYAIEKPSAPLHYGVGWNSSYCNNKLQLRYAAVAGELAKNKWVFMLSGGQQLSLNKFNIFLDLFYHRSAIDHLGVIRNMGATNQLVRDVEYFTVSSEFNYRFLPKWNIRIKGFHNRAYISKESQTMKKGNYLSSWTYQGGLEFFPFADNNLHVFLNCTGVAYSGAKVAYNTDTKNTMRLSLGFVYRLPIL